jgi:hypothetical protein
VGFFGRHEIVRIPADEALVEFTFYGVSGNDG